MILSSDDHSFEVCYLLQWCQRPSTLVFVCKIRIPASDTINWAPALRWPSHIVVLMMRAPLPVPRRTRVTVRRHFSSHSCCLETFVHLFTHTGSFLHLVIYVNSAFSSFPFLWSGSLGQQHLVWTSPSWREKGPKHKISQLERMDVLFSRLWQVWILIRVSTYTLVDFCSYQSSSVRCQLALVDINITLIVEFR